MMKIKTVIFLTFLTACLTAYAEDVNELCKRHSIDAIKTIYEDMLPELSEQQLKDALLITHQSCQNFFGEKIARLEQQQEESPVAEQQDTSSDWFSKYVFEGDPHEKSGVKRLKNRKR